MAQTSSIEWTDATWNPVRGCSRVSEGCRHCYAERVAARFRGKGQPYEGLAHHVGGEARWTGLVRMASDDVVQQPMRWKMPRRIFVNSMSDLFHENLPDFAIDTVFAVMALCPQRTHTYIGDWWERGDDPKGPSRHGLDWVICGGESGLGARPIHPMWVRSLRDQCEAADVPFFFKQWGEFVDIDGPHGVASGGGNGQRGPGDFYFSVDGKRPTGLIGTSAYANSVMRRVGKKAAGRLLDGHEWNEFPRAA